MGVITTRSPVDLSDFRRFEPSSHLSQAFDHSGGSRS